MSLTSLNAKHPIEIAEEQYNKMAAKLIEIREALLAYEHCSATMDAEMYERLRKAIME